MTGGDDHFPGDAPVTDPRSQPGGANPADSPPSPGAPPVPRPAEDEPDATGTLFLTMLMLVLIAAIWIVVYVRLLDH